MNPAIEDLAEALYRAWFFRAGVEPPFYWQELVPWDQNIFIIAAAESLVTVARFGAAT